MRSPFIALLTGLIALSAYKLGFPVVKVYDAPDGGKVMRFSFSKTPGFVAYMRMPRKALPQPETKRA
ncbi:hypothetical protein Tter_1840 [Thermobaculum terrenum ATCC BAA-798]|uniref:Uncharacterized protein n=1 Tax=Thermobaculum terrenum (strain ATCC BAA-798 / CCMEE 7001 / YNP1) TaxID=525904 RepID=D1CD81_THET1|nr:hypothetical protein [Thermobaculum terrenum]ACZ42746.1 hypothetical protein Tter_1840 [Thermobaculum terrenum ATCC BAA-798]